MALDRSEPRWPNAFDHILCPVCGCPDWEEQPREGVFCNHCELRARLQPTNGDRGFLVAFDAGSCITDRWGDEYPAEDDLIPWSDERGGRTATAKFLGGPEEGYSLYWLSVDAFDYDDVPHDEWVPAWDRDTTNTDEQRLWNPFTGHTDSGSDEAHSATADAIMAMFDE